ncbi:MAG: hypothetical protein ACTHJ8_18435 [Mucilaginibacter sp.]
MKRYLIFSILVCLASTAFAQQIDNNLLLEYYQNQRFAEAADYLKKTYPEPVSDPKILASLAYTSQMAGRLPEAEVYYLRIYDKDSTNTAILYNLGAINMRRGNNARALIFYKKILLRDSTNFNVYKQLANLSQNMANVPAAITYLKKANTINPVDADVASDLATILINLKLYHGADSIVDKALNADTSNLLLLRDKAIVNYRLEKFPPTIIICDKLLKQGEGAGDIISMLGTSYYMVKRYDSCINTFRVLEQSGTANETSYYYTAMSNKALNNQQKAIVYFNKAINAAISPNVDSYYSEMADSYDKQHQLKKAIAAYQKSLLYDENPVLTYYAMAYMYDSELKNPKAAAKYYKKYLKARPPERQKSYIEYSEDRLKQLSR